MPHGISSMSPVFRTCDSWNYCVCNMNSTRTWKGRNHKAIINRVNISYHIPGIYYERRPRYNKMASNCYANAAGVCPCKKRNGKRKGNYYSKLLI